MTEPTYNTSGPVHEWFELTYAQYLTVPRSVLQSMPVEWQERFAACLAELDDALPWRPSEGRYWVKLRDGAGQYVADPLREYRHAPRWTRAALADLGRDALSSGLSLSRARMRRNEAGLAGPDRAPDLGLWRR